MQEVCFLLKYREASSPVSSCGSDKMRLDRLAEAVIPFTPFRDKSSHIPSEDDMNRLADAMHGYVETAEVLPRNRGAFDAKFLDMKGMEAEESDIRFHGRYYE